MNGPGARSWKAGIALFGLRSESSRAARDAMRAMRDTLGNVTSDKTKIVRWARGQRVAAQRIASEARRRPEPAGAETLARIDDLRRVADSLGARESPDAARENLAFHVTWARLRRACGVG